MIIADRKYKSTKNLIHYLVRAAGYGANFLLNIGPMPDGEIQPEFTERLAAMGTWLNENGETIYGTKGGFMKPQPWGAVTEKGNKVFIHLLDPPQEKLMLKIPYKVKSARLYKGTGTVKYQALSDLYVVLDIKDIPKKEFDTIIELEITK